MDWPAITTIGEAPAGPPNESESFSILQSGRTSS
jgi:hypothetical protein